MTFVKTEKAGHHDGNLMFALTADDGQTSIVEFTLDCFMHLFVMGWQAAAALPKGPREGQGPGLQTTEASFAVVNLQPALALVSGPLTMPIVLTAEQIAYLQSEIAKFLSESDRGQTH